ncbi:MAG: ACP S-malonyltransferase [Proteobacteria bacterium]|nr:ACP S-malonyltransferase [Pseudomonadota bacterium]
MSSILVFPGQGSQSVGMGRELYDNSSAARKVFDEVDAALTGPHDYALNEGRKLSDIIFNGTMDDLTLTANVQPAIFAVSMAMLFAKIERDGPIAFGYVAGHSLGEYTALCAAGAMSVADTARLLRLRGDAMQAAVPVGLGMVSVILGLDIDKVKEICAAAESETNSRHASRVTRHVVEVANDNAPGQVVISGNKEAVEIAMELAKAAGAKRAMQLPLSAPVHCSLQAKTADVMRAALAEIDMKAPHVPFISNKTAATITDVNEIKDALAFQITHGVRWRETILGLPALGITETVEVGPGNVLTGLTPRIASELAARKLEV